jgi:hypothetical protein
MICGLVQVDGLPGATGAGSGMVTLLDLNALGVTRELDLAA